MKLFKYTMFGSLLLVALTGCGGSDSKTETATFSLGVSDSPIDDASSVVVFYKRAVLLPQGGGDNIEFNFSEDSETPNGKRVDLLEYQGSSVAPLISNAEIPVGDYKLCLFAIDGDGQDQTSYVKIGDPGVMSALQVKGDGACPQGVGKEDGAGTLFFNKAFSVNAGNNSFVSEFELRRGLKEPKGQDDFYTIQRTSVQLINNTESGNISGTLDTNLQASCAGDIDAVYVYSGDVVKESMSGFYDESEGATLPITSADITLNTETGLYEYEVAFLGAGTYSLGYTCQAGKDIEGNFDDSFAINTAVTSKTVIGNETITVDFNE